MLISRTQVLSIGDFMPVYKWDLTFVKAPKNLKIEGNTGGYGNLSRLNFHCITTALPNRTIESAEVEIRGWKQRQAMKSTVEQTLNMTFVETDDLFVTDLFKKWRDLCISETTSYSSGKLSYTADIKIERLNNKGKVVATYILRNCYPETMENPEMSADSSEAQQPSVTMSFDWFEEEISGNAPTQISGDKHLPPT